MTGMRSRIQGFFFTYSASGPADIVVSNDKDGSGQELLDDATQMAGALLPSGGLPGTQIVINLDNNGNVTVSGPEKRWVMVHELGHTIGFEHTDWQQEGINAIAIPGTPCNDLNSVMIGTSGGTSWSSFPDYDVIAVQMLYPTDRPAGVFPLLRYYSGSTGDHFYTIYYGEITCGAGGYVAEGFEGFIYQNQISGTVPIYRYWNQNFGDHFYTRFSGSYTGYVFENIAGYAYSSQVTGTIPIYRYFNGSLHDHFYTRFNGSYTGYVSQGVGWYALP